MLQEGRRLQVVVVAGQAWWGAADELRRERRGRRVVGGIQTRVGLVELRGELVEVRDDFGLVLQEADARPAAAAAAAQQAGPSQSCRGEGSPRQHLSASH